MGLLAVREASGAWMQAAAMFRWMQVGGEGGEEGGGGGEEGEGGGGEEGEGGGGPGCAPLPAYLIWTPSECAMCIRSTICCRGVGGLGVLGVPHCLLA